MHAFSQLTSPLRATSTPVAADVYQGLTSSPKTLSPWLFYDAAGSRLFEEITCLPEYYLTRTERNILSENADAIVAAAVGAGRPSLGIADRELTIIELGAGTATKTGLLLAAAVRRQGQVLYQPIDVSATALHEARHRIEASLPGVTVLPRVADYTNGLGAIHNDSWQRLVLYIGSSIGNYDIPDAQQLLVEVRRQLAPGDCLLLGTDLVKQEQLLLAAYNDASGVTAAFNRNVLTRINRELEANFDLNLFRHSAIWNSSQSRIEMHLESLQAQRVSVPAIDLLVDFEEGETIHTENSYKFTPDRVSRLLNEAGFRQIQQWTDPDMWFGVTLARFVN